MRLHPLSSPSPSFLYSSPTSLPFLFILLSPILFLPFISLLFILFYCVSFCTLLYSVCFVHAWSSSNTWSQYNTSKVPSFSAKGNMGTRGHFVIRCRGRYFVYYNQFDSYPEGLGNAIVHSIPVNHEEFRSKCNSYSQIYWKLPY